MSRRYIIKMELGVAIVVALIGTFFIYQAAMIRPALNDPIGPKVLPMFLAIVLVAGAVLIALSALWRSRARQADDMPMKEGYGFLQSNVPLIFAVIGAGVIYVVTFWALGYFAATFVSVVLIMLVFGNRHIGLILAVALGIAVLYQIVFMGLMGLYDPPGELVDLRRYTNWLSGAQ